jgi:hypothetical protein
MAPVERRVLRDSNRPTVLLAAKTYGSVFYDKLLFPVEKRSCMTALAAISPNPFSLLSNVAHGRKRATGADGGLRLFDALATERPFP